MNSTPYKVFISQGIEIAEPELLGANLPVTQEGADKLAKQMWRGNAAARKRRQLDACYRPKRRF